MALEIHEDGTYSKGNLKGRGSSFAVDEPSRKDILIFVSWKMQPHRVLL